MRSSTSAALAIPNWYVDSIFGRDGNDGLTPSTALQHKFEIANRMGGWSPDLNGLTVTLTYLSPDSDGSDPGLWTPDFRNGGTLIHIAPLPLAAFVGTLQNVTPNSVPGNQTLQSAFASASGAVSRYMLLVNSSRGNSTAIAQRNVAGGTWQISQPMAVIASGPPQGLTNNAWASGDSIQGYVPMPINLAVIGGRVRDYVTPFNPAHQVKQISLFSPGPFCGVFADPGAFFSFENCVGPSCYVTIGGAVHIGASNYISNCMLAGMMSHASAPIADAVAIYGGVVGRMRLVGASPVNVIVESHSDIADCWEGAGPIFIDSGVTMRGWGAVGASVAPAVIYGPGTFNQIAGALTYSGSAAASLPVANLQLNGSPTGYSHATSGGVTTVHGGIPLDAAHLDAAAGAAGFGGFAYGGGAAFSKAGVQP